ncbi:right-handed parallel beta-helix repeat-containing protein [Aurantimonas sp. 22II-16-19i]|uniref:right-handed parallel beta-helix repeat-containing protein n=1 Tax=Aurantimonas sp. 22II-16-19i TaxID=1317114 RepID=UPI00111C77A8|nr:right-handed parallel beta-helix repeat-containing protein [Aurantimonas sp. 22II-16-19i]
MSTPLVGPREKPCPAGAIRIGVGDAVAAVAAASPPGTIFCIAAGIHRGESIAPKDGQRFFGEPGAVLSGAKPLGPFRAVGGQWVADAFVIEQNRRGVCLPEKPNCDHLEQVFLDGEPMEQASSTDRLRSGYFFFDRAGGSIVLSDDPTGRSIEMTAATHAFLANRASNVVVENLTIEKYANPAQEGAVYHDADPLATGWSIIHNTIRSNSGLGVLAGPQSRVAGNLVSDNGQLGISLSSFDISIEGNEIARNNWRGYDPAWEGGGLKGAQTRNATIRGNFVHDNRGPGLWCDIGCSGTLYEANRVENNDGAGIFHEISYDAIVRGNLLRGNGVRAGNWYWGANILIAASRDVVVADNVIKVRPDGTGIALIDQGRERDSGGFYETRRNTITGNLVRFEGAFGRMGGVSDVHPGEMNEGIIETGDNLYRSNSYSVPRGGRILFGWGDGEYDFAGFQRLGQDRGTTLTVNAVPAAGD